jgi:chromosome segregation ATPase
LLLDESVPYSERPQVSIREDAKGRILLTGLKQVTITSIEDLLNALNFGSAIRQTDATAVNARSSRSHAVFSLNLVQKKGQITTSKQEKRRSVPLEAFSGSEQWITVDSKLHFVDLAGSERLKNTGAYGERAKEGISINAGLASLGKVISQLSSRQPGTHISYRDSRLTRLLQDSLGGNAITYMVACINPAEFHLSETLNTVQYAQRARAIQIKPQIQQVHDDSDKQAVIDRLRAEVQFLRDQIRLSERSDRRNMTPQERSERHNEREIEMQNQLLDIQENYNALSQRHAKLISEIAQARDGDSGETPVLKETIGSSTLDRLKRSTSFANAVESVVLEYEKTIQSLEASLSNTRTSLSNSESTLLEKETKLAYLDTVNSQLQSRLQKAMDREANDENYLRELETRVAGANSDEERNNAMLTSLKKELTRVRESEAGAEDYISTLEERLAEAEQQHEIITREIERLEHIVERQRSINKLDNLLYELDHIRQNDSKVTEQPKINGHTRNQQSESFHSAGSATHDREVDGTSSSPAKSFSSVPEGDEHEHEHEHELEHELEHDLEHEHEHQTIGGAVQEVDEDPAKTPVPIDVRRTLKVDEADEPTSPAQSKFVNDKLETVTQELFDLRVEHETTVTDYDELHRKYQVALTSLAELQDALEDVHRGNLSRPVSLVVDKHAAEDHVQSRNLSAELSSVDERPLSAAATDSEERAVDLEKEPVSATSSHGPKEEELTEEMEKLKTMNAETEGVIAELKENYSHLQDKHQETLDYVEELKAEVHKAKGVNGRVSPNPGILRRKERSSVLSDRANRSFALIRNMVLEHFECEPEKVQAFESNISAALTEFHLRSERVIQLEGELSGLRKEMEAKTALITGLTRERSSLKASPLDMSALVSLETQLRESEIQIRSLSETHVAREQQLNEQIEHLKLALESAKSSSSSLTDYDVVNGEQGDGLVSQLQKEVADWRSKHDSAMESMKASEKQLLATINDLETNLRTVEQASRSVSPEEMHGLETERRQHQESILGLQRELTEHKSAADLNARRLAELETSYNKILDEVEKDAHSRELTSKELETHKSLVTNLESQIEAHKAAVSSHQEALDNLRQSHSKEIDGINAEALKAQTESNEKLATALAQHQESTNALKLELENARAGTDDSRGALEAEIAKAKEKMSNLVADAALILNKPTNMNNLTSHIQALVNARKDIGALHETATSELMSVREELDQARVGSSDFDRRIEELQRLNDDTLKKLEIMTEKEKKSSRLVEELEQQLETNFDQANNRLSAMQTERQEALQSALFARQEFEQQLDETRIKVSQLENELAEIRNQGDVHRSNSVHSEHPGAMRKSISPVNLPSPPPAIPLPPLPASGQGASTSVSPPSSRHASKDINTAQLVEDQEARIRTIEKHLFAEKQLTATLEEALTDLESSSQKMKAEMEAWRRKCVALEDELSAMRKDKQNTRLSVQQMEDEARRRIDLERAKLEERMLQLNSMTKKQKKKSSINCF